MGSRSQIYRQISDSAKIQDGCAAILKSGKRHDSAAIFELIYTKFDTDTENKVPRQLLPLEPVSNKIQDGGGRHIKNHIFGHNAAIFARICTEFEI